jgi:hypothetical protein
VTNCSGSFCGCGYWIGRWRREAGTTLCLRRTRKGYPPGKWRSSSSGRFTIRAARRAGRAMTTSAHPPTNRGTLRLDESGRRAATNHAPRLRKNCRLGPIHRHRLQSCSHEPTGSRPAGRCLRPAWPLHPESQAGDTPKTSSKGRPKT